MNTEYTIATKPEKLLARLAELEAQLQAATERADRAEAMIEIALNMYPNLVCVFERYESEGPKQ